jgi:hypothetical protein
MNSTLTGKKRIGRPTKEPKRGKRAPLSLLVRPAIKSLVDKMAQKNGITQSAQAEMLIEVGLAMRAMLDAMGKDTAEIEQGNVAAALRRRGYDRRCIPIEGEERTIWVEPGFFAGHDFVGDGFAAPDNPIKPPEGENK